MDLVGVFLPIVAGGAFCWVVEHLVPRSSPNELQHFDLASDHDGPPLAWNLHHDWVGGQKPGNSDGSFVKRLQHWYLDLTL